MGTQTVGICGGGLAGLTLALQLRQELPHLNVVVIEKAARPLPTATHKVGESSVELGSHYLGEVLGLKEMLLEAHLVKNGLRFFVGPDSRLPIAQRVEIGPPSLPRVPSYQMDRGVLETELRARAEAAGVTLREGVGVRSIALGHGKHTINIGADDRLDCDWVIDATGRRRLIQTQLGLSRSSRHRGNAAWFRVDGLIDIKSLVPENESTWHQNDPDHIRYLSTCHLMGHGHWAWLIPLASGHTSIGVVTHNAQHPLSTFGSPAKMRRWLSEFEPVLAERLENVEMLDFKRIENYSYVTERFIDADAQWSCVGEAAMFADPLYSPGTDFIALHNTLTTETIRRAAEGRDANAYAERANTLIDAVMDYTVSLYEDAAHIVTKPHVYAAKLYWDNFGYWSFLCPFYFAEVYKMDLADAAPFDAVGQAFGELVPKGQKLLAAWATFAPNRDYPTQVPFPKVPSILANLHLDLEAKRTPQEVLDAMQTNLAHFQAVYEELLWRALKDVGVEKAAALMAAAGVSDVRVDESRFSADELGRRGNKIARDVTRVVGSPVGDGVTMRQVVESLRNQAGRGGAAARSTL